MPSAMGPIGVVSQIRSATLSGKVPFEIPGSLERADEAERNVIHQNCNLDLEGN